ncbi:glycosyltransferase [Peribacillus sp. NPDC046944]|uniref:glycosyltransferase n=1 Tax=unclassified Peribacillus TaxID=2675266 RepID=UPI003D0451ED
MKKNILISIYDMEIGGMERSLINMLEIFNYDDYNVDLFILHHKGEFLSLIPKEVNILPEIGPYTVFRKSIRQSIKEGHLYSSLVRLVSKGVANIKAKKEKLEEGPGYIQMQLATKYSLYGMPKFKKIYDFAISYAWPHDVLAQKVVAIKKIAWIHTDFSKLEIDNKLDLNIWKRFDYIASVSDETTKSFLTKYPSLKNKLILIENITSPEFIKSMSEESIEFKNKKEETFNILSVGRLSYVKGFDMAVRALKQLHDNGFTDIKWYVVGYGGYEGELKKLINENNLTESFFLLGKKTNPYPYIKACDLYVQPSRYEGKAVTVTEAKILGKPIIITNYPSSKSQIENGKDGIICDLTVEGLAKNIEVLYKDFDQRICLSKNCQRNNYNNQNELEKLYEIING